MTTTTTDTSAQSDSHLLDPLTRLPNRYFFITLLQQWLMQQTTNQSPEFIVVIALDIDRFRLVNESLGTQVGDQLLIALGKKLSSIARSGDIVARTGSDEFALLIAIDGQDPLTIISERYFQLFSHPCYLEQHQLYLSASMGIAIAPQDGITAEILLSHANQARLNAKQAGGNQMRFYQEKMTDAAKQRLTLEQDLRHAITHNQFKVNYQPKVSGQQLCLIGAEALVSWQHPHFGNLAPDSFIPIAEEIGVIEQLGFQVLEQAIAQTKVWLTAFPQFKMAINLSTKQLLNEHLVEKIKQLLEHYQLPASALELEVTESVAMTQAETCIALLKKLNDIGVQVSLDDFGTGYSSLAYLHALPIHNIKIDRSFISRIGTADACSQDETIVSAIIKLAHDLSLKVVAEGIENQAQVDFLQQQECDSLQGYLFGKSLSAEDFEELAKSRYNVTLRHTNKAS